MRMGKALRALTLASSLVVIGCDSDIAVHDSYHDDRHVSRPRYVEERVVREEPPPRPLPREDADVSVSVDSRDSAPPPDRVVREEPPPAETSVNYDNGDTRPDIDVVAEAPDDEDATYFEDDLRPYGDWVVTADFGRCFRPRSVAADWRPYSEGHWVYTDDGWLWSSDEPFGWATYHYGRWDDDDRYGWIWVPGRTWAPAWVAWRHGGGNAGWAPLPPRRRGDVNISIDIEVNRIRPRDYTFVDERFIDAPHVRTHARPVQQNVTIINNTTNITNITTVNNKVVNRGVPVAEVEQVSGRKVKKMQVVQTASKAPAAQSADSVAVFKKDLPPRKKKPATPVVNTNTKAPDRDKARTLSTDEKNAVDTAKSKPRLDTTPPEKKVETHDVNASNKNKKAADDEAIKRADDARKRADDRDAVSAEKGKKPDETNRNTAKDKKPKADNSRPDANKPDSSHADKNVKADNQAPEVSKSKKKPIDADNDESTRSNKKAKSDDTPKSDPHKTDKAKSDDRGDRSAKPDDQPKAKKPDSKKDDNSSKTDNSNNKKKGSNDPNDRDGNR